MKKTIKSLGLILTFAVILSGCGGGGGKSPVMVSGVASNGGNDVRTVNSVTSSNVTLLSLFPPGNPNGIAIKDNYAYVAADALLSVVDVSDPSAPYIVADIDTPDTLYEVTVSGNYAYGISFDNGFMIFDISNPVVPLYVGGYENPNVHFGKIAVQGNYAYILASGYSSDILYVLDVSSPETLILKGTLSYGIYDYLTKDITVEGDYAYIDVFNINDDDQVLIVDVSNPEAPVETGSIVTPYILSSKIVGSYAYILRGPYMPYQNNLAIYDVTDPEFPVELSSYTDSAGDRFDHVFIEGDYAYLGGRDSAVKIIDVSDPLSPVLLGSVESGAKYVQDMYVSGDHAYITSKDMGFSVYDVSNPEALFKTGGYNGALERAHEVVVSGNYAFVADSHTGFKMFDISSPSNPVQVTPSNAFYDSTDFGVDVANDLAYVVEYQQGLKIIDFSSPAFPTVIGEFVIHYGETNGNNFVKVQGNYAYMVIDDLVIILDVSDPSNPVQVSSYNAPDIISAVFLLNDRLYIGIHSGMIKVLDVSSPLSPVEIGSYDDVNDKIYINTIYVSGNYAYIAGDFEMGIFDVSDPSSISKVGGYIEDWFTYTDIFVSGNYAYATEMDGGLKIFDVSDQSSPTLAGYHDTPGIARSVYVRDGLIYVADSASGLLVFDFTGDGSGANAAPVIYGCSLSPSSIPSDGMTASMLTCTITDPEGALGGVAVDLSAIGGSTGAPMTSIGGDSWQRTGIIAGGGVTAGAKDLIVIAADTGKKKSNQTVTLTVTDAAPVVSNCKFYMNDIQADGVTTTTLTCNVNDANGDLSTVTANLSPIGGAASVALSNIGGNQWQKTGITVPGTVTQGIYSVTVTGTDATAGTGQGTADISIRAASSAPVVSGCSFSPASVPSDGKTTTTLTCTVTDADGNLSGVAVDLSAIGGSTGAPMTSIGGNQWRRTGITVDGSTSTGVSVVTVNAVDSGKKRGSNTVSLTVTSASPVVSGCAFVLNSVPKDGVTTTVLTCTVTDPNSDVVSVNVNLSTVGGAASVAMTDIGGNQWQKTGITVPGTVADGVYSPVVTAVDSTAGTGVGSADLSVHPANSRPEVSGCSFAPASVPSDGTTATDLTCTVTDVDGNIVGVSVNLGTVGGSTGAPLQFIGGNTWRRSGIKVPGGIGAGPYSIKVTAKDAFAAKGSANAALTVTAP